MLDQKGPWTSCRKASRFEDALRRCNSWAGISTVRDWCQVKTHGNYAPQWKKLQVSIGCPCGMCKQSFPVDIDDIPEIEGEGTESSVDKV